MANFRELLEGNIDYHGQKKAENISRVVLTVATILSFVLGFALQSMRVTMSTFALSTVALGLVILPPWPIYNKHPVKWLPAQPPTSKSK